MPDTFPIRTAAGATIQVVSADRREEGTVFTDTDGDKWIRYTGQQSTTVQPYDDPDPVDGGGGAAPPVIGATLEELGEGEFDGQIGLIRLGTYPDVHQVEFSWHEADGTWISSESILMTQRDTWGMDLSNYPLAEIRNAWARFYNGLPYGKDARSWLTSSQNLAALASNELAISNSTDFTTAGTIKVRGQSLTYTGKASGKLTGVSAGTGTMPANDTLIYQGEVGGWGTSPTPLDRADAMYEAGFTLEERANAWTNGSHDGKTMSVAPYYLNVDEDESFALPPSPPEDGLGIGVTIVSEAGDTGINRHVEREFQWTDSGWTPWALADPDARFLIPHLYGKMNDAAANDNGEVYGYTLRTRWVGTP